MNETATFPREPKSVKQARQFVTARLDGIDPTVIDNVALMTSELVTNAIHYSTDDVTVVIEIDPVLIRVTVRDTASTAPIIRNPEPDEPSGRGLQIVSTLADDWGTTPNPNVGNAVWFTVRLLGRTEDRGASESGQRRSDPMRAVDLPPVPDGRRAPQTRPPVVHPGSHARSSHFRTRPTGRRLAARTPPPAPLRVRPAGWLRASSKCSTVSNVRAGGRPCLLDRASPKSSPFVERPEQVTC